jgi:hypothetical protein
MRCRRKLARNAEDHILRSLTSMWTYRGYQPGKPPSSSTVTSVDIRPAPGVKLLMRAYNPGLGEYIYAWSMNYQKKDMRDDMFNDVFKECKQDDVPFARLVWVEESRLSSGLDAFEKRLMETHRSQLSYVERWTSQELVEHLMKNIAIQRAKPMVITHPYEDAFLESRCKEWNRFPRVILKRDLVARYCGARPGEFLRTLRTDIDTGQAPYDRLVVRSDTDALVLLPRPHAVSTAASSSSASESKTSSSSSHVQSKKRARSPADSSCVSTSKHAKTDSTAIDPVSSTRLSSVAITFTSTSLSSVAPI